MPLKDHFRGPISGRKGWESVHGGWAFLIAQRLNDSVLPPPYESEQQVHMGPLVEIDAATFEGDRPNAPPGLNGSKGGTATAVQAYAPPAPTLSVEVDFSDVDLIEIRVYRQEGGFKLVAAVELVSPANKGRAAHRAAFAVKSASYLQAGVSPVVVDVVPSRAADLHGELVELLGLPEAFRWQSPTGLSAVAYRTAKAGLPIRLDAWPFPLTLGEALPTVPLWLASDLAVPLELEPTYAAACRALRIE